MSPAIFRSVWLVGRYTVVHLPRCPSGTGSSSKAAVTHVESGAVTHSYPRVRLLNWFHMRLAVQLVGTRLVDQLTGSADTP